MSDKVLRVSGKELPPHAKVTVMKTKRAERGASKAANTASQSANAPPTRMHCPIKVLRSPLCTQARCHRLPSSKQSRWGEVNLTLLDPDRRRCVIPPALTLYHLWVGTGAWAHGYKRPDEVWTRLPDLPLLPPVFLPAMFGSTASLGRVRGLVWVSSSKFTTLYNCLSGTAVHWLRQIGFLCYNIQETDKNFLFFVFLYIYALNKYCTHVEQLSKEDICWIKQ